MPGGLEIERKFLLKYFPGAANNCPRQEIEQYFVRLADGKTARVRRVDHARCYVTTKEGSGLIRVEKEEEVPLETFEDRRGQAFSRTIEKTRYLVPYEGFTVELDVYHSFLEGFANVEVEFKSEEDARKFIPPNWIGHEVTGDGRYSNRSLAVNGLPTEG